MMPSTVGELLGMLPISTDTVPAYSPMMLCRAAFMPSMESMRHVSISAMPTATLSTCLFSLDAFHSPKYQFQSHKYASLSSHLSLLSDIDLTRPSTARDTESVVLGIRHAIPIPEVHAGWTQIFVEGCFSSPNFGQGSAPHVFFRQIFLVVCGQRRCHPLL